MTIKLFSLKGVPEDEAEDIRELLNQNNIDYYETPGGLWGISVPAIWLNNEDQIKTAYPLIEKYQAERRLKAKQEYEKYRNKSNMIAVMNKILEDPIRFVVYLAIIIVVLYFSIKPFLYFGE